MTKICSKSKFFYGTKKLHSKMTETPPKFRGKKVALPQIN
jgi:hypothetical protein